MLPLLIGLGVVAGVAWAASRAAAWALLRRRRCPACDANLQVVGHPAPGPGYDVLACPECSAAVTQAAGRERFAPCPTCHERALRAPCIRLPAPEGVARVEVREACELCGHHATRLVEARFGGPPRRGLVLEFPNRER